MTHMQPVGQASATINTSTAHERGEQITADRTDGRYTVGRFVSYAPEGKVLRADRRRHASSFLFKGERVVGVITSSFQRFGQQVCKGFPGQRFYSKLPLLRKMSSSGIFTQGRMIVCCRRLGITYRHHTLHKRVLNEWHYKRRYFQSTNSTTVCHLYDPQAPEIHLTIYKNPVSTSQ
jgi:hypothetical protein